MLDSLKLGLIGVAIGLALVVLWIVKKGRMPIKFAIIWLIPSAVILVLALIPEVFMCIASLFGFQTLSNLVIGMLFVLLFFVIMSLTVLIAGQSVKINLLIQEVSLLKRELEDTKTLLGNKES